jgi:hypothetical protein
MGADASIATVIRRFAGCLLGGGARGKVTPYVYWSRQGVCRFTRKHRFRQVPRDARGGLFGVTEVTAVTMGSLASAYSRGARRKPAKGIEG